MTFLYVILWVLLGLVLLIVLLTLVPVRAAVEFHGDFRLTMKYLFLSFPIPIGEPAEEGEEEPGKEPEKPEEPGKPGILDRVRAALKREGLGGFMEALGELIGLLYRASAGILGHLRLRRFDLYICVAGAGDAAAGAQMYGKVSGGVYSACGVLFTLLPCKKKGVTVDLDYGLWENRTDCSAELSILPFFVVGEGLKLVLRGLGPLRRIL